MKFIRNALLLFIVDGGSVDAKSVPSRDVVIEPAIAAEEGNLRASNVERRLDKCDAAKAKLESLSCSGCPELPCMPDYDFCDHTDPDPNLSECCTVQQHENCVGGCNGACYKCANCGLSACDVNAEFPGCVSE
mmetsp:Transcript_28231/g.52060  ORF Transcript_28231/g.52060 Transcript_28231/m.52060 type:complete len:133 (+) Transcript_28231:66-464(+)